MSREEPSNTQAAARSVVLLAGLAFVCAMLAAAWWGLRTLRAPRAFHEPDQPALELEPAGADETPGRVRVHVVDASDGSAIAGVQVELYCEEPLRKRFGSERSDANGDANFKEVFAPLVLAFARRGERFAQTLTVARGEVTTTRVALLRLGVGGQLSGRVIDDEGSPVAEALLSLADISPWPDPNQPSVAAARSAADGSYLIERLANLPRLVTAREQSYFAGACSQVIVEVSGPGDVARAASSVLPGETAIAADIVLKRPPTIVGHVLDGARRPVAGALLSVNAARQRLFDVNLHAVDSKSFDAGLADLPGMARFALLPGEVLTASDGSFELVGASQRQCVLVAPSDGRLEIFPVGSCKPGARMERVEFSLAQREVLRMRLFDSEGRPILGVPPQVEAVALSPDGVPLLRISPLGGTLLNAWTSSKVDLLAELSDGQEVRAQAAPLGDNTFTFALPIALSSIERFSLSAPGYKTVMREVRGRLRPEPAIASEYLELLDNLELNLELSDNFENPLGSEGQELQIRACALAPDTGVADPDHPRPVCCGFGMFVQLTLHSRAKHVAIPMLSERPMWLTLRSMRGGRAEEFVRGPFTTNHGVQTIEIAAMRPGKSAFERPFANDGRRDPTENRAKAKASLCVFDSASHAALRGASIWTLYDPLGRETLLGRTWTADESGCAQLDDLALGSWTFVVAAPGHRAHSLGPIELGPAGADEASIDLGEVQLTPVH